MPRAGIVPALALRASRHPTRAVYFDLTPRYAKALTRWFQVPERWIVAAYSVAAGAPVQRVARRGQIGGSPRLNLEGMRVVSRILLRLRRELELAGWVRVLAKGIGDTEAVAYFHRRFPWQEVWPQVRGVTSTLDRLGEGAPSVMWSPSWPREWQRACEVELFEAFGVDFIPWPAWYRSLTQVVSNLYWITRVLGLLATRILQHRVQAPTGQQIRVATEYVDPDRFGGAPADANFFEDGQRLRRMDAGYFLTREQARLIHREGGSARAALGSTRKQGFRVVDLRKRGLSIRSIRLLAHIARQLLLESFDLGAGCLGRAFCRGCDDIITQLLVFDALGPQNVLHTPNPNGNTGNRLDSAVVTGVSRRRASRAVGYQSRCTYDSVYEDSFDCYDVYLAWGERWREILPDENRYIDRLVSVGCIDNEGHAARAPRGGDHVVVSVFTSEANLFAWTAVTNLVGTCAQLARQFPNCHFKIKTKDPEEVDKLLADPFLREACASVAGNLEFLRRRRYAPTDLIRASDIVLASAFTTPGSDALLLGRRVIYYNEIGGGGMPFEGLPDMIASSPADLVRLFQIALEDYHKYWVVHRSAISRLDPFMDGQSRSRVVDTLLAP